MNAKLEKSPTMSTTEIAKLTGKTHSHVIRDVRNIIEQLSDDPEMVHELNVGAIEILDKRKYTKEFLLNRFVCELLITGYDVVRRANIIKRWVELELKSLESKHFGITRQASKDEYLPMTNAIAQAHEEIKPYHFSNEADLINRIVLGCTASKYRKMHEIDNSDAIRDYLTVLQLECITSLQRANTVYIEDGVPFSERKEKLLSLYNRKHKQKLIDETHLLCA